MSTTKKVVWSPELAWDFNLTEHEVEDELPNGSSWRLYGKVTVDGTDFDITNGGVKEITIHVIGASFWATAETQEGTTVDSLEEFMTLTGMSLEAIGEVIYESYQDSLDPDTE